MSLPHRSTVLFYTGVVSVILTIGIVGMLQDSEHLLFRNFLYLALLVLYQLNAIVAVNWLFYRPQVRQSKSIGETLNLTFATLVQVALFLTLLFYVVPAYYLLDQHIVDGLYEYYRNIRETNQ